MAEENVLALLREIQQELRLIRETLSMNCTTCKGTKQVVNGYRDGQFTYARCPCAIDMRP